MQLRCHRASCALCRCYPGLCSHAAPVARPARGAGGRGAQAAPGSAAQEQRGAVGAAEEAGRAAGVRVCGAARRRAPGCVRSRMLPSDAWCSACCSSSASEAGRAAGVCVCNTTCAGAAGHQMLGARAPQGCRGLNYDTPVVLAAPVRAAQAQNGAVGAEAARATGSAQASQGAPACAGTCLLPCVQGARMPSSSRKAPTLETLCAL